MRVHFKTAAIAKRAATRLKEQLSIKASLAREWTAYVLGYANWHELEQSAGTAMPSPLDEDLTPEDLAERQKYQLERLRTRFVDAKRTNDPLKVLKAWRPSAARPQEAFAVEEPFDELVFLRLVTALHEGTGPPATQIGGVLVDGIRRSMQPGAFPALNSHATGLMRSGTAAEKVIARRILEALAERGDPEGLYNLAGALRVGDGGPSDFPRMILLLKRVVETSHADETVRAMARAALGDLQFHGQGLPVDKTKAIEAWKEAAKFGNTQAAFNVALLHDDFLEDPRDIAPDIAVAARYYRLAAKNDHAHAATNLGLLLAKHPQLTEWPQEGVKWLQRAATLGDDNAKVALRQMERERFGALHLSW